MRFITEFEIRAEDNKDAGYRRVILFNQKANRQIDMGRMIADSFGWQTPVNNNPLHHRLEIEAFPMDKWIEFKNRLFYHIEPCEKDRVAKLLKELESFSKPSGDTITNLSDQMEYRGPSSHCKACEDEAAGIKHIQAQRHTCKFKR